MIGNLLRYWTPRTCNRYRLRLEKHYTRVSSVNQKACQIKLLHLVCRWAFFNNKCCFCGDGRRTLQIDHLVAVSKGGEHVLRNLVPCCKRCNRGKSAGNWQDWFRKQTFYLEEKENKILLSTKLNDPGKLLEEVSLKFKG